MAHQLEPAAGPDKQALATVLSYLKDRRLKETELALKKELGLESVSQIEGLASRYRQATAVSHSDTEPAKYAESYSRLAPLSSTSTKTELQSAARHTDDLLEERGASLSLVLQDELENDSEPEEEEEEEDGDDATDEEEMSSPLQKRSVSWPGCLPNHHLRFPAVANTIFSSNRAQFRAEVPFSVSPSLSRKVPPLWVVGSSAFKPTNLTVSSPPLASTSSQTPFQPTTASTTSPTVLYGMLPSHGEKQRLPHQSILTPLLTIVQSRGLLGTAAGQAKPGNPFLISPTNPVGLPSTPQFSADNIAVDKVPPPRTESISNCVSSPLTSCAELSQPLQLPGQEALKMSNQVAPQRTLASIPPSEMTPQYAELKTFAEEFKTKRIRLGYTQGAVGLSLAQKGYSNFAQSTISRFEQMQLSATNAAAIKLVLQKWLQETEFPESVASVDSDTPMIASRKRKKRAVFTPQTKSTLDEFFRRNPRPNRQAIESIAQQLDLLPEEVRVWFCNKRQKQKHNQCSVGSPPPSTPPSSSVEVAPSFSPKRSSPSPKTSFTIEELSKSSTNNSTSTSPVLITSPLMISPGSVSFSSTSGMYPLVMPNPALKPLLHFTTTQTRA